MVILGESVLYDFPDGIITASDASDSKIQRYRSVSNRIDITDEIASLDPHGQNIIDLNNDGVEDIMISSGGGNGAVLGASRDNFLLWGEKVLENGKLITIFRGGRDMALNAGINMRWGRGRVNYMLDVNGDGFIDIFCIQDRREDNILAPGVLLINQGDGTWKEDPNMKEYTRSMMLTDADGDGLAQEIVVSRGFCYPQRVNATEDPIYGPFPDDVVEFCKNKPVGSTAVYKYNKKKKEMKLISRDYFNFGPEEDVQRPCCKHGGFSGVNDCHAKSMGSGDFDGDKLVDHVFLYENKMEFFYSSDRPKGALPDDIAYLTSTIKIPCIAESIRVLDIDNDGVEEILIMCRQAANFILYIKNEIKGEWVIEPDCNGLGSMGDLVDTSRTTFTEEDYKDACNQNSKEWDGFDKACRYLNNEIPKIKPETAGVSIVDLNNDGLLDAVVTYDVGYTRYFHNLPNEDEKKNMFVVFQLIGGGRLNKYGIGATLILFTKNKKKEEFTQIREVSSYQHTTDKYGNKDDRIIFGLGKEKEKNLPYRLRVKWPDGTLQVIREFEENVDYTKWGVIKVRAVVSTNRPLTRTPTKTLTNNPTRTPTKTPTRTPTETPTKEPTKNPTNEPTKNPTDTPTVDPTNSPSIETTKASCSERSNGKFLHYTKSNGDEVIQKCNWLSKKDEGQREKICRNSSTFGLDKAASYVCPITCGECSLPTTSPNPTEEPTRNPTEIPTKEPTKNPTDTPTTNPTKEPTKNPTYVPTRKPSKEPTKQPTSDPTRNPTVNPTEFPTKSSCSERSNDKFLHYTKSNGDEVTQNCNWLSKKDEETKERVCRNSSTIKLVRANYVCPITCGECRLPTTLPKATEEPTRNPTKEPTRYPTKNPTNAPNKNPTNTPVIIPTSAPTRKPTNTPTKNLSPPIPTIVPTKCFEIISHTFTWYIDKNDKEINKSCGWLLKEKSKQASICSNPNQFESRKAAKFVCPITCKMCKQTVNPIEIPTVIPTEKRETPCLEKPNYLFVRYIIKGTGEEVKHDCNWLSERDEILRTRICKNSKKFGLDKAAKFICPMTCRQCNIKTTKEPNRISTKSPSLAPYKEPFCFQKQNDKFVHYIMKQNGEEVKQNCEWLSNIDEDNRINVCKDSIRFGSDRGAKFICPVTCGVCNSPILSTFPNCIQNESNEFLWLLRGNGTKVIKSCKWLSQQAEIVQSSVCTKKTSSGKYRPANTMCPRTCKSCEILSVFAWYIDSNNKAVVKDCDWLSKLESTKKDNICKTEWTIQNFMSARLVCRSVCGVKN